MYGPTRGGEGWGYALRSDEDEADFWGFARGAEGLFTPLGGDTENTEGDAAEEDVDTGRRRVLLTGCRPEGGLLKAAGRIGGRRAEAGNAHLRVLDPEGVTMGAYFVGGVTAVGARPSAHGTGLVDLTVDLWCDNALPGSEAAWDLVRAGGPDRTGLWRGLSTDEQWTWLSVALWSHEYHRRGKPEPEARSGRTVTVDGRYTVDRNSFFCAIGEAVNGPGGYFGWNLDALDDCLIGGWGAARGYTLEWVNSAEARARLVEPTGSGAPLFDVILEIFEERGVSVVLR
ncbi:barstar family protein [Streptomyces sp. NBC_00102]|uniref:barstar family protein n=1 Tax=Streptomyces sp. NBC_00102 TaxID=2975652 RepID=UPI002254DBC3|nr:barstar family protein [Streptomyces sp. NBC_00102]MCX5399216.1 barstar family protein [Streptomyces sp. NBC_00102]